MALSIDCHTCRMHLVNDCAPRLSVTEIYCLYTVVLQGWKVLQCVQVMGETLDNGCPWIDEVKMVRRKLTTGRFSDNVIDCM